MAKNIRIENWKPINGLSLFFIQRGLQKEFLAVANRDGIVIFALMSGPV
jgi:hypothetical protein